MHDVGHRRLRPRARRSASPTTSARHPRLGLRPRDEGRHVGADCNIGDHAFIESGATLGDRVTVKNAVLVWDKVTIEDDVFLGPNVVFTNDMNPRVGVQEVRRTSSCPRW